MDPFLSFVFFVAIIGLIVWGVSFIPKPAPFQTVILVAGIIVVLLALLQFLGVATGIPKVNFIR